MRKPIVHYSDVGVITVGSPALVVPVDHPSENVSNKGWARTSPVISFCVPASGVFETLNTIYHPVIPIVPADSDHLRGKHE